MTDTPPPRSVSSELPRPFRTASEWSWRFLVIVGALAVVVLIAARLEVVLLAVFVALLACALLHPLQRWLRARGVGRAIATTITLVVALVVVGGTLGFVIEQIVSNYDTLASELRNGYDEVREWLRDGPLGLSDAQVQEYLTNAWNAIRENSTGLASGAFRTASTALEVVSGAAIALFATVFILYDGPQIWRWVVGLFPTSARDDVEVAGGLAWATLTGYIRGRAVA